jgi:hypothetical protein
LVPGSAQRTCLSAETCSPTTDRPELNSAVSVCWKVPDCVFSTGTTARDTVLREGKKEGEKKKKKKKKKC